MILFKKITDFRNWHDDQRQKGLRTGFVPTMGALHAGHISLVNASRSHSDITVCSIFINPTQFNDPGDFQAYPSTIESDIELLEAAGCEVLFLPSVREIYPEGLATTRTYDLGYLEKLLEGKYRPGHFQGVCRVVHRLLDIVRPQLLFLGQKDYQQCMVIRRLIDLIGLKELTSLVICPTLREPDGLAMSSRNLRLDPVSRKKATAIFETLQMMRTGIRPGNLESIGKAAIDGLEQKGFKVDYAEIADADTLMPVREWDGNQKIVALIAAFLGAVRLIDNTVLNER